MISIKKQRTIYILSDWFAASLSFFIFNFLRFHYFNIVTSYTSFQNFILSEKLILEQIFIPLLALAIYWFSGYYNKPYGKSRLEEFFTTIISAVIVTLFVYLALLTNDQVKISIDNYKMLLTLFTDFFFFTYLGRFIITTRTIRYFRKGSLKLPVLIIGGSETAINVMDKLNHSKLNEKYDIIGCVAIPGESFSEKINVQRYELSDLGRIINEKNIKHVYISPEHNDDELLLSLLNYVYPFDVSVKISPDIFSFVTSSIRLRDIFGEPFVDLASPLFSESSKNIKRAIDVVVSSLMLILVSLPIAIFSIIIKKTSDGPVIFKQERIGYRQRPFNIYKLRSMYMDAEAGGPQLSSSTDKRITKIGKIMRKYRIDELPQFWNVLKGDMSLIGPRPERKYFIDKIKERAPYVALLHQIKPGITSWGVVKYGYASNLDEMIKRLRLELIYLQNMSLTVDLKILIYTVKIVFSGVGK